MYQKLTDFLQDVKDGKVRGDYTSTVIDDRLAVELSVADFQYGYVHFRAFVECDEREPEEGMYYRQLYAVDDWYANRHEEITEVIEAENETVRNAHEWQVKNADEAERLYSIPGDLNPEKTLVFEEHLQLRDDVSLSEAIATNRQNNKTRSEITDMFDED